MLLEEMENLKDEVSFPRENFHFLRSDSCLTERREDKPSRFRKMKVLSRKRISMRDSLLQSNYLPAAWMLLVLLKHLNNSLVVQKISIFKNLSL